MSRYVGSIAARIAFIQLAFLGGLSLLVGCTIGTTGPSWRPVGPAPELNRAAQPVSGRIISLAWSRNADGLGHPAMFLGTDGGGVWRSYNFADPAPSWTPLTDHLKLNFSQRIRSQRVTALAVNPVRPREIYAAVGDAARGILVSTDGGDSWTLRGEPDFKDTGPIRAIAPDLTDPTGNILYVGLYHEGIFRSPDAGATWESRSSGLPTGFSLSGLAASVSGLGALILYAGVTYATPAAQAGIWRSIDGGLNWTRMIVQLDDREAGGIVTADKIISITFAIDPSPGAPNGAYAAISNTKGNILNIFKLNGAMWFPAAGDLPKIIPTQGAANQALGLSPDGTIYLGTIFPARKGIFQSKDRGATWHDIGVGANGVTPHVDFWVWQFALSGVYAGNDGGIWRFVPRSDGTAGPGNWESLNTAGLQTIESNGVGVDPANIETMLEGSQDNALARRENGVWHEVAGGDSGPARFEPDPQTGSQFAYFVDPPEGGSTYFGTSDDGGKTWVDRRPDNFRVPDYPEFAAFTIHPYQAGRLMIGLDRVYETVNRGKCGFQCWTQISPAFEDDPAAEDKVLVSALAYGLAAGTIFVAYENGHVWMTKTGGGGADQWLRVDRGMDWQGKPVSITPDPLDPSLVFLTSRGGKVWRTPDGAITWEDITGQMPKTRLFTAARPGLLSVARPSLIIGTEAGVLVSRDQSAHTCWVPYLTGMPDVEVRDLQLHEKSDSIVAATYGRGIFVAPLTEIHEPNVRLKRPDHLSSCRPDTVLGAHVQFGAELEGLTGAELEWSVDGASWAPDSNGTGIIVDLPNQPSLVRIAVKATAETCAVEAHAEFVPWTPEQAARIEHLCKLRTLAHPNRFIDPLWDPLRRPSPVTSPQPVASGVR